MRKRSIVTPPAAKLQVVKHKDAMKSISLILLMLLSSMASIQFFAIDASATNTDQDGDGLTYGLEYLIIHSLTTQIPIMMAYLMVGNGSMD